MRRGLAAILVAFNRLPRQESRQGLAHRATAAIVNAVRIVPVVANWRYRPMRRGRSAAAFVLGARRPRSVQFFLRLSPKAKIAPAWADAW